MNTIDSTRICFTLLTTDSISRLIFLHQLLQQPKHRQVANELIEFWRQDQANPPTGDIIVLLNEPSDEAKIMATHTYLNSTYHNNEDEMRQKQAQLNFYVYHIKNHPVIRPPLVNAYKLLVTTKHFFHSQNIALSLTYIGYCISCFIDQLNLFSALSSSPRLFQVVYDQNPEEYRQQQEDIFNVIQNDLTDYLKDIKKNLKEETWILDRRGFFLYDNKTLEETKTRVNSLEKTTQTLILYWQLKLILMQAPPYRAPNQKPSKVPLCQDHNRRTL